MVENFLPTSILFYLEPYGGFEASWHEMKAKLRNGMHARACMLVDNDSPADGHREPIHSWIVESRVNASLMGSTFSSVWTGRWPGITVEIIRVDATRQIER